MRNSLKFYKRKIMTMLIISISLFQINNFIQSKNIESISKNISEEQGFLIRTEGSVCDDEKGVIEKRRVQAKSAVEMMFGKSIDYCEVPSIGIAASGGGYRSMICALGFLTGLEKKKILDSVSYMSTVSGSGWTIATWIAQSKTLSELKDFLRAQVLSNIQLSDIDWSSISKQLFRKISSGQPVNESDIWGCFLSRVLLKGLKNNGHGVLFSDLAPMVKTGTYPFPILTAIIDDTMPYEWCDFTPFEVGSFSSQAWISSSQFGKKCIKGISTNIGPEQTLGYILGLTSSIFAAPLAELLHSFLEMIPQRCCNFENIFSDFVNEVVNDAGGLQLPPPTVFNFMKNIESTNHSGVDYLSFFDAGVDTNIGVPPLLNRNVQVYLVCDASVDSAVNDCDNALTKAAVYAKNNSFKFPKIPCSTMGTDKVSLFYDENDPEVPVIIYFPNQVYYPTFKTQYTEEEFNNLYRYMKDAVEQSYETICKGISIAVENLRKINKAESLSN